MNTQDKLAEALRLYDKVHFHERAMGHTEQDSHRAGVKAILQAHAAEAAQAQAQSGDMVTFVHHVLEHFPLDAEGFFLPLSANRLAFAIEKSHAAAPQQAAEPIGTTCGIVDVVRQFDESVYRLQTVIMMAGVEQLPPGTKLYIHPDPADHKTDQKCIASPCIGTGVCAFEHRKTVYDAERLAEALRKIAEFDCGCVPCVGECRKGMAAEIELQARMEIAQEALAAHSAQAQPPAAIDAAMPKESGR